jgi:DnaD/phage-associated family protein
MRIDILTLFPASVDAMMNVSILGRAQERGYITSWLDMGFGCDAIAEAYDRTVVATGARKWAYLNRILMSWHEKGLHTPEEIETGDPRAAGKRRAANPAAPAAERDDLDRVEQLLRKMEQTNT